MSRPKKKRTALPGEKPASASQTRHEAGCTICAHPQREHIERDFLDWQSPIRIAFDYGLSSRTTVYLHARAFNLFAKRDRNIRAALARIIEKSSEVEATAPSVVAAVQAYSKINAQGHWVERMEHVDVNALFERMSKSELETYAKDGTLPGWFTQTVSGTATFAKEDVSD